MPKCNWSKRNRLFQRKGWDMTETVMQFKSVDDIIRFSRAAEQCTSHTYIMQGKTKIRADDLLAIFCVDYTVPVVVIHEDATEFAHAMMIEKAKVKKKKR